MTRISPASAWTVVHIALALGLAGAPAGSLAQSGPKAVPENAYVVGYGTGWECNLGYSRADGTCVVIEIPPDAFATGVAYGRGWE